MFTESFLHVFEVYYTLNVCSRGKYNVLFPLSQSQFLPRRRRSSSTITTFFGRDSSREISLQNALRITTAFNRLILSVFWILLFVLKVEFRRFLVFGSIAVSFVFTWKWFGNNFPLVSSLVVNIKFILRRVTANEPITINIHSTYVSKKLFLCGVNDVIIISPICRYC